MAVSVLSKFRACMVGSVIGDCLGAPFEGEFPIASSVLTKFLQDKLTPPKAKDTNQVLPYTDDTAMTRSVAQSLIDNKGFNGADMAERFTEEYFNGPKRGYGANVAHIFHLFKLTNYDNIFGPAKEQFEGAGSYGNGAAMRVAPVALFCHQQSKDELINLSKQTSLLTHSHPNGYKGAILQCLAVHLALGWQREVFEPEVFVDRLIEYMEALRIEEEKEAKSYQEDLLKTNQRPKKVKLVKRNLSYAVRLENVKKALNNVDLKPTQAAEMLGNDVSAPESVPSAIYAFLRGLQPINVFKSDNPFVRTLYLSVAMGGDTDTIASMALAIAGAYHGLEVIPMALRNRCEGIDYALQQGDRLAEQLEKK